MILYSKTYDNIRTRGLNFPVEDAYLSSNNMVVVADGITRDPIGIADLKSTSFEELVAKYPRPSGGELAAKVIVNSYNEVDGTPKERLIYCNKMVKKLNDDNIKKFDYLENDYYGAVACAINILNNKLYYAYICDCGVIVYDKDGNIKFKTEDDKAIYSDQYIAEIVNENNISWNLPEARVIVRRDFRNNLCNIIDGRCVSYGSLTGEEEAIEFIREGIVELEVGDYIAVYSDGFSNFLYDKDFINLVLNFNDKEFDNFVEIKANSDYNKYGSEKTIVLIKYC